MNARKTLQRKSASRILQRRAAMPLAFALLCLLNVARCSVVCAQETPKPASPFELTPLQRQIERERARLKLFDVEERRDAVQHLGAIARPESSRAASVALHDSAAIVRATAAHAVLSLPAVEAAGLLLPLLGDKDEFVRRETAYALGAIKSRGAVSALVVALARDKSAAVRGATAVALGQIGDASATPQLAQTLNARIHGTGLISRVTRSKTDEDEFVRRAAAVALGQIASRDAVPALISTLANERAGDDVRREAARALGLIGDASAVPALRAALTARDPYLSQIAHEALRRLDPANAARPT